MGLEWLLCHVSNLLPRTRDLFERVQSGNVPALPLLHVRCRFSYSRH